MLDPDSRTARSISHFAPKYGTAWRNRSSSPERAREYEPPHARLLCRSDEVTRPLRHDPLEVGARSVDDRRDEMDDRVDTVTRRRERSRVADVALDELGAPVAEPRGAARVAYERAHPQIARTQRVHDVAADEAGAAGDENRRSPIRSS